MSEENLYTFENPEYRKTYWHTCSHIMAQAVKRLWPEVQLAIGPAIDEGWYYDFDAPFTFTPDHLEKIEAEMKKICKERLSIVRSEKPRQEAIAYMKEKNEPYKVELIEDLPEDAVISFYTQGEFTDLCAGPHLDHTGRVKHNGFKLTKSCGAYWRGDSKRKMLQRIYGVAFPSKDELDEYLKRQEEAQKRDHNKLGREMEFFTTVDCIGQGLPVLLPKGARVIQVLQRWVEDEEQKRGYLLTKTPLMAKRDLYKISGHWDHYLDGMFVLGDPYDEEKECFALRPMTCPFQYQVYLNRARSYRDLPMRLGETSTLFRNEDSGEMHGLIRVRQFTISEGHLVLRPDQLEDEFRDCLELAKYCLDTVGLLEDCTFRFSQWDPANPKNKYEGTAEQWETAQATMKQILDDLGVEYTVGIDEAAFYGPKLDIQYKNVFGKEDTLVTIQIDMLLAARFGMEYTDADGQKKLPYIIHRTSLGCYERTLAYLIEKYAGALPLWMMPTQVKVLPITDRAHDYAESLVKKLSDAGIRAESDLRSEKLGYKIREAQMQKIPYMLVVGDRDMEDGTVSVRTRKGNDLGAMTPDAFLGKCLTEIATKTKDI
ncbi:MAG: threonine--tRNA ligase [Firmicutes bacterium]|nr:threonine--tRNA ligase [Clostridiales bacterium]MDD6298147.1 threonine--tRNA ligase [Bacillota bacterium]MDD7341935.1 threonine--tRNA ligase [Bacillota bacterium]